MGRERKGYVYEEDGKWYARVTYTDGAGKRRNIKRVGVNKSDARTILRKLNRDLDDHGTEVFEKGGARFKDLAEYYKKQYITEPVYVDGRKVSGLRSAKRVGGHLKPLQAYFDKYKLSAITYGVIEGYRNERLKKPTERAGTQRAIASVNRELALLRRMLTVAEREGWIRKNPFAQKTGLIMMSAERKRERILTGDEEARLLSVCTGPRAHLKAILICALDTGMRHGEIIKLTWRDVDLEGHTITIAAFNTKTMQERRVAMTERLYAELSRLFEYSTGEPDDLVFGITDNFKNAFKKAKALAGIVDFKFHDCRHSAATRLIQAGMSIQEVGRILGHTQAQTTYRYVNADSNTAQRAARLLDEFNESRDNDRVN